MPSISTFCGIGGLFAEVLYRSFSKCNNIVCKETLSVARNKEFDESTVLRKAMNLFWQKGFEKTSMQDLVVNMGIHRRSMYDTFGDKHALFMKAMDRYEDSVGTAMDRRIKETTSVKQAIRALFDMVINQEEPVPKGCLIVNTAVELAMHDSEASAKVKESFSKTEKRLYELVFRGQSTGEVAGQLNAEKLSRFLNNSLVGLRVMVKTTNDREELEGIIDTTLAILD
jgi:TetR/AcrR family transcriptional repressor of nem operon